MAMDPRFEPAAQQLPAAERLPRFSCRVVYLQATSEEPESVADHCLLEHEGVVMHYQTTCW